MDERQQQKYRQMTETPVERLVCRMAVPTIVSMLVSAFYNMVDTLYVGHVSTSATAAVGIIFSYMALIQAVAFFLGHGSGNFISRALGRQDPDEASRMAATGFFSALIVGGLIMLGGFLFLDPLLHVFGAIDEIYADSKVYFSLILLGTPYMMASLVLNNQMRLQGNAFFAMIGIATGAVLNIGLDPLFIFTLRMGVAGAALATILSQFVSFLILLVNCGRGGGLAVRWRQFRPTFAQLREIAAGGLPSLCRQGLASIAVICLNHAAKDYGSSAIAAFSIVSRISLFSGSALLGFGQGFQPVCGFNYGAGLYDRVRRAFWFCVKVATVCMTALGIVGLALAPAIIALFRADDALLVEIGARALRWQCLAFPLQGFIIIDNMYLQNTRQTVSASLLALARQGIFFLPLIWLLPPQWGLTGIETAQPLADLLTFGLSVPLGAAALRRMGAPGKGMGERQAEGKQSERFRN